MERKASFTAIFFLLAPCSSSGKMDLLNVDSVIEVPKLILTFLLQINPRDGITVALKASELVSLAKLLGRKCMDEFEQSLIYLGIQGIWMSNDVSQVYV
ncbi:hypothetical protein K7X08_007179 [Anisodus acutangulus]|uniref:Uncharacterized protein n=1 Tax=Anisodus acutangulus TaxID=402998 RepID=A0A9Q1R018_9SOLA|nr:hypothetical protein K7X08_007179 [Anisodus acutangulus]